MTTLRAPFDTWLAFLAKWEGGESDDPADHGGRTVLGISATANPDVDLDDMTPARLRDLALGRYWRPCGGDALAEIAPCLAVAVADYGFHSGPATAVRDLQRIVAVAPDGIAGPRTLEAVGIWVATVGDVHAAGVVNERRRERLRQIATRPGQSKFLRGWLRRVDDLDALLAAAAAS